MALSKRPASRRQLETILEHIADGITVQNAEGDLTFVNPTAARLMGFDSPQAVLQASRHTIMSHFSIYDERLKPLPWTELPGRRALMGETAPVRIIGFKTIHNDDIYWSSVKASAILDAEGKVEYVVNVFQDITQLKNTELRLKDANNRITRLLESVLKADEPV